MSHERLSRPRAPNLRDFFIQLPFAIVILAGATLALLHMSARFDAPQANIELASAD